MTIWFCHCNLITATQISQIVAHNLLSVQLHSRSQFWIVLLLLKDPSCSKSALHFYEIKKKIAKGNAKKWQEME